MTMGLLPEHKINEQAIRAAQQIRLKPAQLGGQPIESRAIVHIIFQLAS